MKHLDSMDSEAREVARKILRGLRSAVNQHLGPITKRQLGLIEIHLRPILGDDWVRFTYWLTGYDMLHIPQPWATKLVGLLINDKNKRQKVTNQERLAYLVDFFHYQEAGR